MHAFKFYEGPSMIDGSPIVAIATVSSGNSKTGNIVQTWIMPATVDPITAVKNGDDAAVCGTCKYRPITALIRNDDGSTNTRCYVNTGQAPLSIFGANQRGVYPLVPIDQLHTMVSGMIVRLGSWGDPFAVPLRYWLALVQDAASHRGYTHGWRTLSALPERERVLWQRLLMASVDSPEEYSEARAYGWRTFRVSTVIGEQFDGEISCPASREAGYKSTCEECSLCSGTAARTDRTIVILDHAAGWKNRLVDDSKVFFRAA